MSESVIKWIVMAVGIGLFLIIFNQEISFGNLGQDLFKARAELMDKVNNINEELAKKKPSQ